jgi:hypothetical protein
MASLLLLLVPPYALARTCVCLTSRNNRLLLYSAGVLVGHFYQRQGWWYYAHIAIQVIASILFFVAIGLIFSCTA